MTRYINKAPNKPSNVVIEMVLMESAADCGPGVDVVALDEAESEDGVEAVVVLDVLELLLPPNKLTHFRVFVPSSIPVTFPINPLTCPFLFAPSAAVFSSCVLLTQLIRSLSILLEWKCETVPPKVHGSFIYQPMRLKTFDWLKQRGGA
jgi:hypothetical protein